MVDQSLWLKVEKLKQSPLGAIKGLFIKEEDFVHVEKDGYRLHVRYPARGADNYDCMLTVRNGNHTRNVYPVPLASLKDVKLCLANEAR